MQIKKTEQFKVSSFADMKKLATPSNVFNFHEFVTSQVKDSHSLDVVVLSNEHANCDALPLRYGMHFTADVTIKLSRISLSKRLQKNSDRIGLDAYFLDSNDIEQFGQFVVGERRGFDKPVLITVWRNDTDTELHLSEVMMSLRKREWLTPKILLELHPMYLQGKIATHADLVILLGKTLSEMQVQKMSEIVSEAVRKTDQLIAERDAATALAEEKTKDLAKEKGDHAVTKEREKYLEKEVERYKLEKISANRENKHATLSSPDTLVQVLEGQIYRGSSCTILKMSDGSQRHMKTSTFDPTGSVTAHAKTLIGKRVRISCWDPIEQPGKWSNEGYFRNVYATE
jgi:hypothetical protein